MFHRYARQAVLLALGAFTAATSSAGVVVADSVADFSSTQGANNWYYGYAAGNAASYTASSFKQMSYFDANNIWHVSSTYFPPWTSLWAEGGHPNGFNTYSRPEVAVRRWISEVNGLIDLNGEFIDVNANAGDGVAGAIFVGGNRVWSTSIGNGGGTLFSLTSLSVTAGTPIDFVLDPRSTDYSDSTRFTAHVTSVGQNPANVPEPGTCAMLLVGLGGMGMVARRRRISDLQR